MLTLVVGTASLKLADSAKQAGLRGCSGIYLPKSRSVAIFVQSREFECLFIYLYIALVVCFCLAVAMLYVTMLAANGRQ